MDFWHRFTDDVKSCPKESRYKLTHCDLQRFLWRLWKRKDENPCYTRARKPQNEVILDFYTLHPIQILQLSFSPHQASEKKLPTARKLHWRFPQKRGSFLEKSPTFFCFSPTFFHFSRRKTKKIATFSNGKKQGLMPFHQDSSLVYSNFRRKTRFFRKISTSICANQQNSIPLRYSIEKHGTYSPRKKRSFVQSFVLGLAQTPDFFALYYDNNGFCHKKGAKSSSKRIRNKPS